MKFAQAEELSAPEKTQVAPAHRLEDIVWSDAAPASVRMQDIIWHDEAPPQATAAPASRPSLIYVPLPVPDPPDSKTDGAALAQEAEALLAKEAQTVTAEAVPKEVPPVFDDFVGAAPPQLDAAPSPEDNELLLEVIVGRSVLDGGMLAHVGADGSVMLPLSHLMRIMEFPIEVMPQQGSARGWFIREKNSFVLEPPHKHAMVAGRKVSTIGKISLINNDIYVSTDQLSQWFPVDFVVNYNELRLFLKPHEPLPFQERADRQQKWENLQSGARRTEAAAEEPPLILPYYMFSPPTMEVSHNLRYGEAAGVRTVNSDHTVNAYGDLLKMDGRVTASYNTSTRDTNEWRNITFNLSREDYSGRLLGFMKATDVEIGDLMRASFPLAGSVGMGRGVAVGNAPFNFVRDPDNFIIEGFGPAGWDVEVYQDQRLLDFQTIGADGRYNFQVQSLKEGFNLFRIALFGPNGEREERFERYYLGQNMLDKGQFIYDFAALESTSPLFDFSTQKTGTTDPTVMLNMQYGLSDAISLTGGYYTGPQSDDKLSGAGFGARISAARTFTQLNVFTASDNAYSASADIRGNLSESAAFAAGHTLHDGYGDNIRPFKEQSYAQVSQNFGSRLIGDGSIVFEARRELSETDVEKRTYLNRISTNIAGWSVSHDLEFNDFGNTTEDHFIGNLTLRHRLPFGVVRGRVGYRISDTEKNINAAELQHQWNVTRDFTVNTQLSGQFGTEDTLTAGAGISWRRDKYRLELNGSIDNNDNLQVATALVYNLIPNSRRGDYAMTGRTEDVSAGRLILRPFIDHNSNDIFDEGDEVLHDAEFKNATRGTKSAKATDGSIVLGGMTPAVANTVEIVPESLPSIFMSPAKPRLKVLGKWGVSGPVDFPVHRLGEITGTLIFRDAEGIEEALSSIPIALLDENAEEIARVWSEYDGFFSFTSLPMGRYTLWFPSSESLHAKYTGDSIGIDFDLSVNTPDFLDTEIIVLPDNIFKRGDELGPENKALETIDIYE